MEVAFDAGVKVDIATGDQVDGLHGKLDDLLGRSEARPLFQSISGSIVGNGVVWLSRPPLGKLWNILLVTLVGNDDATAVTGKGALYVDSEPTNLSLGQARLPGLSIPSYVVLSKGTVWAHSTGNVVVNVTGVGATQQVVANIHVAEWRHTDVSPGVVR